MDDIIHAERVEEDKDENKKYLKTNKDCKVCDFNLILYYNIHMIQ